MRRASVAIVPLIFAVFMLFWFIMFMGGENDNLHNINQVENLQHLQERLALPAMKKRIALAKYDSTMTAKELESAVNIYINRMMVFNKIQEE